MNLGRKDMAQFNIDLSNLIGVSTWQPRSKIPVTRSRRNLQERDGKNAGSCRNTPEVIGTWKQYSGRKISGFFPVISHQFLAGKHRKVIGMHRKKSRNFQAGILLPCSDDFRCIPAGTVPYSLTWEHRSDCLKVGIRLRSVFSALINFINLHTFYRSNYSAIRRIEFFILRNTYS